MILNIYVKRNCMLTFFSKKDNFSFNKFTRTTIFNHETALQNILKLDYQLILDASNNDDNSG